jgi:hypothetical protein
VLAFNIGTSTTEDEPLIGGIIVDELWMSTLPVEFTMVKPTALTDAAFGFLS